MDYVELTLEIADDEQAEILTAELADFPFESFERQDSRLKAYVPQPLLADCKKEVDALLERYGIRRATYVSIESQDWNAVWESSFEPVEVDGRLTIRAPFHAPSATPVEVIVMPRMSFGTGHHATTCLMAAGLLDCDVAGRRGLDMGSGTGVLAILAAKLGADSVDAVDIDRQAYENGIDNIRANGVEGRVVPLLGDAAAIAGRHYDFVLANINRNTLLAQLPIYADVLGTGGRLSMSGMLEADAPTIADAARDAGFAVIATALRDGWARVDAVKR